MLDCIKNDGTRPTWTNYGEFFLAVLGLAVGLGNVWRFPYLCYYYGGGSFLVAYVIMLFFFGLPMFITSFSVGQFSGMATGKMFRNMAPLFAGIGYALPLGGLFLSFINYSSIIAWSTYYFYQSFTSTLPWTTCNNWWNTEACWSLWCVNSTENCILSSNQSSSSASEFFTMNVVRESSGIEDQGDFNLNLFICYLAVVVTVYFSLFVGVKSSGKVVLFTATFPYIALVALSIQGFLLDGSTIGVHHYLRPKWSELRNPQMWAIAASQVFYSISASGGALTTLSSYNKFHSPVIKTSLAICILDTLTSFTAGFAVFTMLGHIAHVQGVDIDDVAKSGPGLAFVVYPSVLAYLPGAPFWSAIFFLMLITLGLDSLFGILENIVSSMEDLWPRTRNYHKVVLLITCIWLLGEGSLLYFQNGVYIIQYLDHFNTGWISLTKSLVFAVSVSYGYGIKRFFFTLKAMIGKQLPVIFKLFQSFSMLVTLPVGLLLLLILSIYNYTPLHYEEYQYPPVSIAFGWCLAAFPIIFVVGFGLYHSTCTNRHLTITERLKQSVTPTDEWWENYRRNQTGDEDMNKSTIEFITTKI